MKIECSKLYGYARNWLVYCYARQSLNPQPKIKKLLKEAVKEIKGGGVMKRVWISLSTDKIFKTEAAAFKSREDFIEGYYCNKCKCTTTTECACKK